MKINRLETHDRLEQLKREQSTNLAQGVEDCLKKNPLSLILQEHAPYIYIFAHPRTADDGITKRMLWQPRLSRPLPQTNSYLFRAISKSDVLEVCWMIPPRELWPQYEKGKVTENEIVMWSINQFKTNKKDLESAHSEDLSDEKLRSIYRAIKHSHNATKMMDSLYLPKLVI